MHLLFAFCVPPIREAVGLWVGLYFDGAVGHGKREPLNLSILARPRIRF